MKTLVKKKENPGKKKKMVLMEAMLCITYTS